jgi:hypothetical protein
LENLGADGKRIIKMNHEEIGLECMNWIQLIQDGVSGIHLIQDEGQW